MATPGDIRVGNSLLPAGLRELLGLHDDGSPGVQPVTAGQSIVPFDATAIPPPAIEQPAMPVQQTPDYQVPAMDKKAIKAEQQARVAQDKATKTQQTASYAQSQRMPTLADTMHEQQTAAAQGQQAIANATDVAANQADATYQTQLGAQAALEQNDRALAEWQKKSDETRAQKEQHAAAMMADVDATKIDNNQYWTNASDGKKAGWFISMALAGLGDIISRKQGGPSTGGMSPVMEMLQKTIDKNVQQQVMDRDAKKERLGRAQADVDSWDRFSASKEARIAGQRAAAKEMVAQQIEIAASKYGSQQALANGQRAAAELRKSSAKDLQQAVDMAHQHAMAEGQLQNSRSSVAQGWAGLKLSRDKFDYDKTHDKDLLDLERDKLTAKGDPKAAEAVQKFGVAGVTQPDGSQFIAQGTPEGVEKLREKKAASMTIVNLLDSARRIRTGWTSDTTKSKEWQELQQIWSSAKAKGKDSLGLGALSGDDYKILDGYLGSSDPTKFQDPTAGIVRARKTVIMDLNESLKAHGYQGEYDVPDITGMPGAVKEPGEAEQAKVLSQPNDEYVSQWKQAAAADGQSGEDAWRSYATSHGHVAPGIRGILETYAANLNNPDEKKRKLAVSFLTDAANHAEDAYVKELAQGILANTSWAAAPNATDTPAAFGEGNATVRDSFAQPAQRLYPTPKGTRR